MAAIGALKSMSRIHGSSKFISAVFKGYPQVCNNAKIFRYVYFHDKYDVLRYQYVRLLLQRACSGIQGAQQTLRVRKRIEEKSSQALLGGGQKRIDAQHKKVRTKL